VLEAYRRSSWLHFLVVPGLHRLTRHGCADAVDPAVAVEQIVGVDGMISPFPSRKWMQERLTLPDAEIGSGSRKLHDGDAGGKPPTVFFFSSG